MPILGLSSETFVQPPPWAWIVFGVVVTGMLSIDLISFSKRSASRGVKEAAFWSVLWVGIALLFNGAVYFWMGSAAAEQFATAYLVERALSVDNLFVFLIIFRFFGVPMVLQHRVLFWGILGALVMRGLMIGMGVGIIMHFQAAMLILAGVLIFCGIKLMWAKDVAHDPAKSWTYRLARRFLPFTEGYREEKFFVVEQGMRKATPLLLVLLVVESTDLVFAIDSIPACLGISTDLFVVYTSNIFAILGLRALYFLLAGVMDDMRFLKPALSAILVFIGLKMIMAELSHMDIAWAFKVDDRVSLAVVLSMLVTGVGVSFLFPEKEEGVAVGE